MPMRARAATIIFGLLPSGSPGWSQREYCELDRIRDFCRKCPQLEIVTGESDEGDPWTIVCDREGEWTPLHVAKIDRGYVIAWPCRHTLQKTTSIAAATNLALRGLERELCEHFHAA